MKLKSSSSNNTLFTAKITGFDRHSFSCFRKSNMRMDTNNKHIMFSVPDHFEYLRIATISFAICVCPPVHPSICPSGTARHLLYRFSLNSMFEYFSKICQKKYKFHYNRTRITDTVHEDQYTFLIISRSVLLRMRNVSGRILTYLLTYSMEQSPSWEANWFCS